MNQNPLTADLDHILDHTRELWEELRGERLFITGGTGFFGCWLMESFTWANDRLNLGAKATVLTRSPDAFGCKAPQLACHPSVSLLKGDVRSFDYPEGMYKYVVHAAAESSANLTQKDVLILFDILIYGTRRVLDFTRSCAAEAVLLTSSGAVFGTQPSDVDHLSESFGSNLPNDNPDFRSAYWNGKRVAEFLSLSYAQSQSIQAKIARCFAFLGPYQPLNQNFAIGNFIQDGLAGGPIIVKGDGTPFRSYMYAADLAIWLWTILLRGDSCKPYNVGSEDSITIKDLAYKVANAFSPARKVEVMKTPNPQMHPERYVPSTKFARESLRLNQYISLEDGIDKTIAWHQMLNKRRAK